MTVFIVTFDAALDSDERVLALLEPQLADDLLDALAALRRRQRRVHANLRVELKSLADLERTANDIRG